MRKVLFIGFLSLVFFFDCKQSKNLSDQLKLNFSNHLKKIDSSLVLDSFRIISTETMVERGGRIMDDSMYKRDLYRVQLQLANATKEQKKDSMKFYQYEINYMLPQIDSLTNSISKGDTTKIFGFITRCFYQIRKNNISAKDSLMYFFDTKMNIRNSGFIDTLILRTYKRLI